MTEGKRKIIQGLLQEYEIQTAKDIQEALKDLLGGTIKEMLEAEMDNHLGYEKSERSNSENYRNGYKEKTVNTSYGSMSIEVPQDRKSTFEPQIVKKRQKDISEIDQKIISMYAKGMTTRQISDTLMDIYGFEVSDRKLNRQRSVFPSSQALLKALYLSTFEAKKKWTMPLRNWGQVYGELTLMYEDRLPE